MFKSAVINLCSVILLMTFSVVGNASSTERLIKDNCANCHGLDGQAVVENYPNLACQNYGYLYIRLIKLKQQSDHDIEKEVKSLSLSQINEVAKYFASISCRHQ